MAKDLFSTQSADYAKYRPSYPAELIHYIIKQVPARETAWDCATGNGQAAVLLSPHFKKIVATDTSEKQLALAVAKDNITYSCSTAEQTKFTEKSFDLITIGQAYHWFQFDDFEKEVRRVSKPGAVIAAWGYNLPACSDSAVNEFIIHFYTAIVGAYWDEERKYVEDKYNSIPFPYADTSTKEFYYQVKWRMEDVEGYLNSWSSVQNFIKMHGYNPVTIMATRLAAVWPESVEELSFTFPIFLKTGKVVK